MNSYKLFFSGILALAIGIPAFSQNEGDVRRYTSQYMSGTARFNGLGGAMGALGGDLSAIHSNPAGVGVYRFSDFSLTPTIEHNVLELENMDGTWSDDETAFKINNIGLVFANEMKHPNWKNFNFGISYQRLNTFQDNLLSNQQLNLDQSLMQDFVYQANGFYPDELSEFNTLLAWEGYVIDTLGVGYEYIGRAVSGQMQQVQRTERKGGLGDFGITMGANYSDFLYLGAGIGILSANYQTEVTTTETPTDVDNTDLVEYTFKEKLKVDGLGINGKFGFLLKLGKAVRVGGSIHTPSSLSLTDTYENTLSSTLRDPYEEITANSSIGEFSYRIQTPWRYMVSAAAVVKSFALISAQYEYTDYSSGKLKNSNTGADTDFSETNRLIQTAFGPEHGVRAGVEFRVTPNFYMRGGTGWFKNPVVANDYSGSDLDRRQYSGGIGIKKAKWNVDFAYQFATYQELYQTNGSAPTSVITNKLSSFSLTVGLRM